MAIGVRTLKTTVKNPPTVAEIPPITPAKVASHRIHLNNFHYGMYFYFFIYKYKIIPGRHEFP